MKSLNKYKNHLIFFFKYFISFFLKRYLTLIKLHRVNRLPIEEKSVFCFYHQNIFMLLKLSDYYLNVRKITFLSQHQDADILDFILKKRNFVSVRTDSLHFNPSVFKKFIQGVKNGCIPFIAMDGPVGPNKKINLGSLFLAKKLNWPIRVIQLKVKKFWQIGSWDQHIIPKPFSEVMLKFTSPFFLEENQNLKEELKRFQKFLTKENKEF